MNILDEIVINKKNEILNAMRLVPGKDLENSEFFSLNTKSLKAALINKDKIGIIAEYKRRSPAKGILNLDISVKDLTTAYIKAGASALSVLTDNKYFGGSNQDLKIARQNNSCPILRKDFILDPYQILEAKSIGADVILLIARILSPNECESLAKFAHNLGLETLLEIHSEQELESHLNQYIDIVGVNNRDLDKLTTSIEVSISLAEKIPKNIIKISESGIKEAEQIIKLKNIGYNGFLIGEAFMQSNNPANACHKLIELTGG